MFGRVGRKAVNSLDCWFKCDKGWFGVGLEHRRMVLELLTSISFESEAERIEDIPPPSLQRTVVWAEDKGIPYEVTTVKPVVREKGGEK